MSNCVIFSGLDQTSVVNFMYVQICANMKQSPNCGTVFSKIHSLKRVIHSTHSQQSVRFFLEAFLSNTYDNVSHSKESQQVFCGMYSPMYKINFKVLKWE